jgi:hypothetical protein
MSKTVIVQAQQRWDYCIESRKTESSLMNSLTNLGQLGWELVNVLYYKDLKGVMTWTAFLKRPSVAQPSAPGAQPASAATAVPSAQTETRPASPNGMGLSSPELRLKPE